MSVTELLERIFAVLALAAASGAVLLWLGRLVGRRVAGVASIVESFADERLWLGALVAAVAMGGSLYFSIGAHFTPCRLCWIQRGFMYPQAFLLAWAAWKKRPQVRRVAIPMSLLGGSVSIYHVLLERYPTLESDVCSPHVPCNQIWFKEFGFLTLPGMALSGFAFIATVLALPLGARHEAATTIVGERSHA